MLMCINQDQQWFIGCSPQVPAAVWPGTAVVCRHAQRSAQGASHKQPQRQPQPLQHLFALTAEPN